MLSYGKIILRETFQASRSFSRYRTFSTFPVSLNRMEDVKFIGHKPNQVFVNGSWIEDTKNNGKTFPVFNPATNQIIDSVNDSSNEMADLAIKAAKDAFPKWKKMTAKERGNYLLKIKDHLTANKSAIAKIMTLESGKPLRESETEMDFSINFFQWFEAEGRRAYGETIPSPVPGKELISIREPMGVAVLVTPWNFPFGMLARKASAALAAGCTLVIKPSEDTPFCALAFAKMAELAGLPHGVVNVVTCSRDRVANIGELLFTNSQVSVLSFTGSTGVGKWLYEKASSTIKKISLELGGNAPFIVFNDAEVDVAVNGLFNSKFRNAGQTCITPNRIFVHKDLFEEFKNKFVAKVKNMKVGPGIENHDIGPLINQKQLERVENLLRASVEMGAKIVCGGNRVKGLEGHFLEPTVVVGVTPQMPLFGEEIFGPIAAMMSFENEEEILKEANSSQFGLASFFFTRDLKRAFRVARELDSGMVGVNDALVSTCESPFGGVKYSGFGVEGSKHGLDSYSHVKGITFGNM